MTLLTDPTGVFLAQTGAPRCAVMFLSRRQAAATAKEAGAIESVLLGLRDAGWSLSVGTMLDPDPTHVPTAYATAFAHDLDMAGLFEAPSLGAALTGTIALEAAGWGRLFATEWLLGPREFAAVHGAPSAGARRWGFLALWEWNDAWSAAAPAARKHYDAECDVAFAYDLASGINIAGRHRLDWASRWHHLGAWEADTAERVDAAMREHERAADFKFTTSRHYIGLACPLLSLIRGHS
jgi:hypothetical protein